MSEQQKKLVFVFLAAFFAALCTGIYVWDRVTGGDLSLPEVIFRGSIISLLAAPFIYRYLKHRQDLKG